MTITKRLDKGVLRIQLQDPIEVIDPGKTFETGIMVEEPKVIIDNGSGVQAMIVKFRDEEKGATSFGHLALGEPVVDAKSAKRAKEEIVTDVFESLSKGGSGAEPLQLQWNHPELSLTDVADALSKRLGSAATVEIPDVVSVRGEK
jgi:hypothetical protein